MMSRHMQMHDVALLILRVTVGIVFAFHGWQKVSNPEGFFEFFMSQGFPQFAVYLVGYVELIGGVMLIAGLWTSIVAIPLAIIIATALFWVKGGALFRAFNVPVFETDLVLLASLVVLALEGSGVWAMKKDHGIACVCTNCGEGDMKKDEPAVIYPNEGR